jgi:hypothetical protein
MHSKESKWDADEIIDTKKLQFFSLCQVMQALHYEYVEYRSCPSRFESKHHSNKGREVVSVPNAIRLHNGDNIKCVFGRPPSKLTILSFNDYTITNAKAARVVKKVKLQFCRQTNQLICQDHRVQFVYGSYSHLFLHNKYLG